MNVSEIVAEFGDYYLDSGQGIKDIFQKLRRSFVSSQVFSSVYTDDTIWRASESRFSKMVQPFQKAFTPKGSSTFLPVEIRQFKVKADASVEPDDLEGTWLGFLGDHNVKRSEWPLIRWLVETQFIPQIKEDTEIDEIGIGVYTAPTQNVAGPESTSMNGMLTVLNQHITDGRTIPMALGALPTNDDKLLVKYLEEFHKMLDKRYRNQSMVIYGSEDMELSFLRGYGDLYGTRTVMTAAEETSMKVKHTNLLVKGLPSLNFNHDGQPNDRFFCTPKANAILLQKKSENQQKFDIQAFERVVKFLTDWWIGVGFIIPEIVFCNDGGISTEP